jgi:hypothetical protein
MLGVTGTREHGVTAAWEHESLLPGRDVVVVIMTVMKHKLELY